MTSLRHLRSSTANKRPDPTAMVDGQLAMNYDIASPGLFFKDDNGTLIKVGPVHVGTTAPNVSPAAGGTAGNSIGEQWLDTTSGVYVLKVWDGSAWRSESGTFVDVSGDTMTGALTMANQQAVRFSETTANGSNYIALQADAALASNKTITLPDTTGTVVTTGDTGTVTSTMIANGTILNADVNASAAIAGTKVSPDFGSQTIVTTGIFSSAAGTAAAPSIAFTGDTNTGLWSPAADTIAASTGGSESLRIDSSGRLLVGTSTSTDYYGATAKSYITDQGGTYLSLALETFRDDSAGAYLVLGHSRSGTAGNYTILQPDDGLGLISFNGSDGTDLVSVGATIKAEVDGTPGADDMPCRLVFSTTADGASSPTERMRITNGGEILVNSTTTRSVPFSVEANGNGSAAFYQPLTASYTSLYFLNPNGTVGTIATSGSSTSYNTSSDYRLKENVSPVTDGITRLQQLKPSRFNFIADPGKTVDGFIAHEVQAVVPEAITGEKDAVDDDGNLQYQGIDQSKLVPLLTAALQEAIAKIETLEGMVAVNNITIDEQQNQLSTLAARLTALESA
jgi:hypothetical protein